MNFSEEELESIAIGNIDANHYLHGYCHDFAYYLSKFNPKAEYVVITEHDWEYGEDCILHVCLESGNNYYDILGKHESIESMLDTGDFNTEIESVFILDEWEYKKKLKAFGIDINTNIDNRELFNFIKDSYIPRVIK